MPERLTRRQLNRALLARQMLLERQDMAVPEAVERLVGLQAQIPNPPYIGLWTRLRQFERDDLTRLMGERQIVRAAMMRSTLHLVTAADHHRFRATIQPALVRALAAFFGKRANGLDAEKLVQAVRPYLEEAPRTTGQLRALLLEVEPERDADAMAYLLRTYLPLIQVPPGGTWGTGSSATYVTAESWLGQPDGEADPPTLFRRYLAAFGPASVADFQTWSGLTKLKDAFKNLKSDLRLYHDETGRELVDLTEAPLPDEDTPAPVRFIPEYDNLLLAHADRTRIITDEYRARVFLSAGRVRSTFLVDGFVAGAWKAVRVKNTAALIIEPFVPLSMQEQEALTREGECLIRFIEDDAQNYEIRFADVK
jgi:hypothetical protein